MKLVPNHLRHSLHTYHQIVDDEFEYIFSQITNKEKESYRFSLIYIDNVINSVLHKDSKLLNYMHLHLDSNIGLSAKRIIGEFLIIKFFFHGLSNDSNNSENQFIENQLRNTRLKLDKLAQCPEGAKGGSRIHKNWISEKLALKNRIKFYKELKDTSPFLGFYPTTLINLLSKDLTYYTELFSEKVYAANITESNQNYVLLNDDHINTVRDSKINDRSVLQDIKNVLLLNSESRVSKFEQFNYQRLFDLRKNHSANFKNLFVVTFCNNQLSLGGLGSILKKVNLRYYKLDNKEKDTAYSITNCELSVRSPIAKVKRPSIFFFGEQHYEIWDEFIDQIRVYPELYELRSLKMMNIYSLVFSNEIKDFIINDIFNKTGNSKFLSEETQETIKELEEDIQLQIKESLIHTFNLIIGLGWQEEVLKHLNKNMMVILPHNIYNSRVLTEKIQYALKFKNSKNFISWQEYTNSYNRDVLILSYQDIGFYPYYFYPNIFEIESDSTFRVKALFLSVFFKQNYNWAKYRYNKEWISLLDHPIRREAFNWDKLIENVNSSKPEKTELIDWTLESSYNSQGSRFPIKVKYKSSKKFHNYDPSELFIYNHHDDKRLRVQKIDELVDENCSENQLKIYHLDEIIDKLRVYDKLADINKQDDSLKNIRSQYEIDEEEPGRLWKILLQRLAVQKGETEVYEELRNFLVERGLTIVSFNHFQNNWINPESPSLTPQIKKVFLELCNFLGIHRSYVLIMLRIKSASKQKSTHQTRKLNRLFMDLFNDGCFDEDKNIYNIIESRLSYYKNYHSLDEIGIDESNILENLIALINLVSEEIQLIEVESIETTEYDK